MVDIATVVASIPPAIEALFSLHGRLVNNKKIPKEVIEEFRRVAENTRDKLIQFKLITSELQAWKNLHHSTQELMQVSLSDIFYLLKVDQRIDDLAREDVSKIFTEPLLDENGEQISPPLEDRLLTAIDNSLEEKEIMNLGLTNDSEAILPSKFPETIILCKHDTWHKDIYSLIDQSKHWLRQGKYKLLIEKLSRLELDLKMMNFLADRNMKIWIKKYNKAISKFAADLKEIK